MTTSVSLVQHATITQQAYCEFAGTLTKNMGDVRASLYFTRSEDKY